MHTTYQCDTFIHRPVSPDFVGTCQCDASTSFSRVSPSMHELLTFVAHLHPPNSLHLCMIYGTSTSS